MFVFCVYIYKPPAGVVAPKYPERTTKKEIPPETMDEAMDDDTKDPGPFQQRNDPAAEPEDAVAESMDETMDSNSLYRQATPPQETPFFEGPTANAHAPAPTLTQRSFTKTQKKNRMRERSRKTRRAQTSNQEERGVGGT